MLDNTRAHILPRDRNNDYNLGEMGLPSMCTSSDVGYKLISLPPAEWPPSWARFMHKLLDVVSKDRRLVFVGGVPYCANINWLRDHVHEMKAFKHWEHDLKGYLEFMVENQNEEGFFYEMAVVHDNFHTGCVNSSCVKQFPDDGIALVRIEIEADIEYLVVEGAVTVYKATGDDEWIKKLLPSLEKGIDYCTSNPKRWDAEHGLMKRAFTIDTWDFTYGRGGDDRNIKDDTPMSIMHGDNSGLYQAMCQLAWLNQRFGNEEKAKEWDTRAQKIRDNMDKYCWNGNFYTHQIHLNHDGAEDADESKILSLSNTYDMNRCVTSNEQAEKIISEYILRRETTDCFAEWFCVDPPYTKFKDPNGYRKVNDYVNGGISSFTAGELAKAAFSYGFEEYGYDILKRIKSLTEKCGSVYFLYEPYSGKNLSGGPSGWGAAAIMDAVDHGLAGIIDTDVCYKKLLFSPKWAVTELEQVRYFTGYEVSKRMVETRYTRKENSMVYELFCPSETVDCHILLPKGKACSKVLLNGGEIAFKTSSIRESCYVDFSFENDGATSIGEWGKLKKHTIELVF